MSARSSDPLETLFEMDFNNVMAEVLSSDNGLALSDINELKAPLAQAHKDLMRRRADQELPFYDLPFQTQEVKTIRRMADDIRKKAENFVVLGIGGSSLGAKALFKALTPLNHNLIDTGKRRFPRLFVADNVDPEGMVTLLNYVDPRRTVFNVISKSGATAETMSQFMIILDRLRRSLGKTAVKDHIVLTTDPDKGILRELANEEGFRSLSVPPGVGGRYSVFTPVGLLPLAVIGVNVAELLKGAAAASEVCTLGPLWSNPSYLFAAVTFALRRKRNRSILVMMPYADALAEVADWFNQLWAESLGQRLSTDGREVLAGQTPVKAVGATDQHSQLQLYMEGPQDKVVVFIGVKQYRMDIRIPAIFEDKDELAYMGGHTLGELIQTEQAATARALAEAGRPNLTITLPGITPASMGYLLYFLEVATVASGYLYQINPLVQPGVERGKKFVYGIMGRPGYESFEAAYNKRPNLKKKYIFS